MQGSAKILITICFLLVLDLVFEDDLINEDNLKNDNTQ